MRPFIIVLTILSLSFNSGYALESENVTFLSEILQSASYNKFTRDNDRLYVATAYGFEVFDVSDPANLQLLGRAASPGFARDLAVKDGIVYLLDQDVGLNVYDARDPEAIDFLMKYPPEPIEDAFWGDVAVQNDLLLLVGFLYGIEVLDISDPTNPEYLTNYNMMWSDYIAVSDSLAYLSEARWEGFYAFDFRNPQNIRRNRFVDASEYIYDIALHDGFISVGMGNGIALYNTDNPAIPRHIVDLGTESYVRAVAGGGNHLWASVPGTGIQIYDLADPEQPELVQTRGGDARFVYDLMFQGDSIAYASGIDRGIAAFNTQVPAEPELLDVHSSGKSVSFFDVQDHMIYLPRFDEGLLVIDATTPEQPEPVLEIDTCYVSNCQFYLDSYLFLITRDLDGVQYSLQVWEVSNGVELQGLVKIELNEWKHIEIAADLMILDNGLRMLEIWDISTPEDPYLMSVVDDVPAEAVCATVDFIYSIGGAGELAIIDMLDPENPALVGTYDQLGYEYELDVKGNLLFVATGNEGVKVLDISNFNQIGVVATIPTLDWSYDVFLDDTLVYVGDSEAGLSVYYHQQDEVFTKVGFLDTPANTVTVLVEDGITYLGDLNDLTICRFGEPQGISEYQPQVPETVFLNPAYPNPFNSTVKVPFTLRTSSQITVSVFNETGQLVHHEHNLCLPGSHIFNWESRELPSGQYLMQFDFGGAEEARAVQKVNLVK